MNTMASKEFIFREIDRYYFTELMDGLHPSLQSLLRDKRLLHLSHDEDLIHTLAGTFNDGYILAPWQCADILVVPDDALVAISQAHAALMIAYLILDVQVDNQLPKSMRLAPLACTHLVLSGRRKFAECIPPDNAFWDDFDAYFQTLFNGLTAESASLDGHDPLYNEEVMRDICHEKAAQIRLAARAMSAIANDPDRGSLCEMLIDTMFLGDQLTDDLVDWKQDFAEGRITYPIQQVIEYHDLSVEDVEQMAVEDLRPLMEKPHLDIAVLDKAAAVYTSGRDHLRAAGCIDSRWDVVMADRANRTEVLHKRLKARHFVENLAARL